MEPLKIDIEAACLLCLNMDTSFMNEQEKINHNLLVDKMGEIFELTQKLKNTPEISNREMWQQLGPLLREARPMLDIERNALFKKTFSEEFGLSDQESENFRCKILRARLECVCCGKPQQNQFQSRASLPIESSSIEEECNEL